MVDVRGAADEPSQPGKEEEERSCASPTARRNHCVQQGREAEESATADEIALRVSVLLERCKALQEEAATYRAGLSRDADAISQNALALESQIRLLQGDLSLATDRDHMSQQLADRLGEELYRGRSMIYEGDVGALLPYKCNVLFLRLLLGPVNVRAPQNHVRLQVKEEYNTFRDRTAVLFLAFPSLLLLLNHFLWNGCVPALLVQAYQAWLLFFYTSLALRENILRVNGSDILPWWVYHHYFAMAMALISLTWGVQGQDACQRKQEGVRRFLSWAVMQGVAMLLQNRYQRQRLYTRIALGKAGPMDVVWGETAGVKGQLWVLYPLLFILQAFQFEIGLLFLRTAFFEEHSQWQVVACGLLLVTMAVGNFLNTVSTVVAKMKKKAKMKTRKRQALQPMSSKKLS